MTGATRCAASAALGVLMVVGTPVRGSAQHAPARANAPVHLTASAARGTLAGVVLDERGLPVQNVVVSALGAATTVAVTDTSGQFDFGMLAPGPYLVRAHLAGFVSPRAQMVQVRSSARAVSTISLRREGAAPVLLAGIGPAELGATRLTEPAEAPSSAVAADDDDTADRPSETAWRLRHSRRGVLKDAELPEGLFADAGTPDAGAVPETLSPSPSSATSRFFDLLADTPISGQVNLLAASSFDTPQQLFSADGLSRSVANVRLGAPAGAGADWAVAGAITQADISSWVVAGSYAVRAPARHRYDIGMSYSTQRYDGGNPLALRAVTEGSRNVGTIYGYDSVSLSPKATISVGTEYAHYDYLSSPSLVSPRVGLTVSPSARTRVTGSVSLRSLAPGAEEFLPPGDAGIWLPPQRTFSAVRPSEGFTAERTFTAGAGIEQDFGTSTLAVRAFRQHVDDQLVTVFGAEVPGQPSAKLGHYLVDNTGDIDATGFSAEFRAVIASRVHGSVEYTVARGRILQAGNEYLLLLAPEAATAQADTLQDVTARIETEVPETATRVLVAYRMSNGFAEPPGRGDAGFFDGRFEFQVRQSLPFMNFSSARWEMLFGVRNFFRDASCDQSLYDELFVIRPPKRVVGGVTLHF